MSINMVQYLDKTKSNKDNQLNILTRSHRIPCDPSRILFSILGRVVGVIVEMVLATILQFL